MTKEDHEKRKKKNAEDNENRRIMKIMKRK